MERVFSLANPVFDLGQCLGEQGRLRDAVQATARAADMDPEDASYLNQLIDLMNRWDSDVRRRCEMVTELILSYLQRRGSI